MITVILLIKCLLVRPAVMISIVARKVAGTGSIAPVFEADFVLCVTEDDRGVEVNQVRVVFCRPLRKADSMRVMAGAAGSGVVADVQAVTGETLIGQDAVPIVAIIAKRISIRAFRRTVAGLVITDQQ